MFFKGDLLFEPREELDNFLLGNASRVLLKTLTPVRPVTASVTLPLVICQTYRKQAGDHA